METNKNDTVNNEVATRKSSKLQLLKSLNGNLKKLIEHEIATEQEIKIIKEILQKLKKEVIGEL